MRSTSHRAAFQPRESGAIGHGTAVKGGHNERHVENPERRCHKRFAVTGKPLAVMKPGPAKPGQVARISDEAAEILYHSADGSKMADTDELNILVARLYAGPLS